VNEVDIAQFVISAQEIADALEPANNAGAIVRGIGDSSFFYRYYSEFQDMAGLVRLKDDGTEEIDSFTGAVNNPWSQPGQMRVASLAGGDKWHHKYIRVDDSVLTGSHNAPGAASFTNDEAIMIIYDAETASEFAAHFDTSFCLADGGDDTTCYTQVEPEPTYDGGTWETITFTGEDVGVVLDIINNASLTELDIDAAMNKRAAQRIINARPIVDMDTLELVPYVGRAAMEDLKLYIPTWIAQR
jgi:hypothetical protein